MWQNRWDLPFFDTLVGWVKSAKRLANKPYRQSIGFVQNEIDVLSGTLDAIRTRGLPLRSGFNTLLISNSKTWKTLDTAGFHHCYTANYVQLFSANFHRFLWSQLAGY